MALMEEKGISAVAVVGARDGAIVGNFSISELRWVLGGGGWVGGVAGGAEGPAARYGGSLGHVGGGSSIGGRGGGRAALRVSPTPRCVSCPTAPPPPHRPPPPL